MDGDRKAVLAVAVGACHRCAPCELPVSRDGLASPRHANAEA